MDNGVSALQVVLILFAGAAGLLRFATPYARFTKLPAQGWAYEFKPWQVKLIGALEIGAAVGLIVPLFVPALALLTPLAAVGVALVMAGAIATHLRRSEYPNAIGNLVWLGLALSLAYGKLIELAV